jgi:uncharacterized caspase-like protein
MAESNSVLSPRRKFALIIGNNNYSRPENRLYHCITDADDLGTKLKTINFKVNIYHDLTLIDMFTTINEFLHKIVDADLVLFYFSGHGCQVDGKNYLIPVNDAQIVTDVDVKSLAVGVEYIIKKLTELNPSNVTVFLLNCCQNYWPETLSKTQGK